MNCQQKQYMAFPSHFQKQRLTICKTRTFTETLNDYQRTLNWLQEVNCSFLVLKTTFLTLILSVFVRVNGSAEYNIIQALGKVELGGHGCL